MSSDHPLHPATVHFPIAFFTLASGLDVLYGVTTQYRVPYLVKTLGPSLPDIGKASYYLYAIGLITTVPAILTGAQQLLLATQRGGWTEQDGKTLRPKIKVGIAHALTNDLVTGLAAYCWWTRGTEPGFAPNSLHVLFSAILMPILFFGANLGGTLTYNHGMGMSIGKKNKAS